MKPCLTINVNLQTRKALYKPSVCNAMKYHLDANTPVEVDVFGLFQVKEDEEVDAYFVVKLQDGNCCYAGVEQIKFLPEDDEEAEE